MYAPPAMPPTDQNCPTASILPSSLSRNRKDAHDHDAPATRLVPAAIILHVGSRANAAIITHDFRTPGDGLLTAMIVPTANKNGRIVAHM
jgi:hypothetical protein